MKKTKKLPALHPLDAHGVLVEKGNRVKSVVGSYHATRQFYGRVDAIDESLIDVTKENPGSEVRRTRSAARLWELATEDEKAIDYPPEPEAAPEPDEWEDARDEWSGAIEAAHPTRSGSYEQYAVAMQMVSSRRSKGELVALVNWLLVRAK